MKYGVKQYRDWHFSDGPNKWKDNYHYVSMNADMNDLELYKNALLKMKAAYQNDYFSTNSTFSQDYLKKKIDHITTLVQGLDVCINKLEAI